MCRYEILDVHPQCSTEQLKFAYKISVLMTHPDKKGEYASAVNFQNVEEAWSRLKDPEARATYDQILEIRCGVGCIEIECFTIYCCRKEAAEAARKEREARDQARVLDSGA